MSSLTEIRDALKKTISQAGLHVYETVADVTNSPAAVIMPDLSNFGTAMAMGGDKYHFDIPVLVAAHNIRDAQRQLDQFVTGKGEKSIREFLFRNSDLGLDDVDCHVEGFKGYGGNFKTSMTNQIGAVLRVCVVVL
ncbi:MAG TPA: hypothetical protein VHC20_06165 [Candidatus Paceibacterota bacterium]|nr:hypothetical protein [Candidatus Paceibacterota bacterium]